MAGATTLLGLIAVLSASPPHSHEDAERLTGIHLIAHDIRQHRYYEARNIKLADGALVDFLQFYDDVRFGGAYITFAVSVRCYTEDDVKRQFSGAQNLGEEMRELNPPPAAFSREGWPPPSAFRTLKRREGWGTLLFDFGKQGPCLKSAWVLVN